MGSSSNLVRSMLAIIAFVAVLVAIVPRISSVEQPAVDAASVVSDAVRQSGLPLEAPVGLPAGWKATSARYGKSTDDIVTWQGGWTTPDGSFVALRQAEAATPKWIAAATTQGVVNGSVDAAGRTWEKRYDAIHGTTSLVNEHEGGLTTVVAGTAPLADVLVLTNALRRATSS